MFIVSKKSSVHGALLVITDKEIMNQKFIDGKLQLDLTKEFYKGEEKDVEEVKMLIPTARHLHFTGKNSVELGKERGLVKNILVIKNIPHAEVMVEG